MANDTQARILDTALELFSQNGYAGTSMSDIAGSLGLTKAALYKHFASKEAIRSAMIDSAEQYYGARFGSRTNLPQTPGSAEEFCALAVRMAEFTIRDEKIKKVRKLLTLEQFRDERMASFATLHFITEPEEIFCRLFRGMMDAGLLKQGDPSLLAFCYTAPVSALIHLCDREPGKTEEALQQIRDVTEHFIDTYGMKE